MPKLHELLAVENSLENQANKVRTDLVSSFSSKRHLFEEKRIVFSPSEENSIEVTEQQSDIQSTVRKELDWIVPHLSKAIDASYQVAETNTQARADVVLEDDTILLKNIPATALLELEKRIAELHVLISSIPTLDPAKGFTFDSNRSIYQAREILKTRTRKSKPPRCRVCASYPARPRQRPSPLSCRNNRPVCSRKCCWFSKIAATRPRDRR